MIGFGVQNNIRLQPFSTILHVFACLSTKKGTHFHAFPDTKIMIFTAESKSVMNLIDKNSPKYSGHE